MRVVVAGGGTAGHVNPAIALARVMTRGVARDEVKFLGTRRGAEARLVPAAGFSIDYIKVSGFDRSKPWLLPRAALVAGRAVAAARRVLVAASANALVGMGGYVSLPAVLAARSLKIPVVLHEQNIVFGLAHKVTRPFAAKVAVSFEDTLTAAGDKGVYVGNPVSPELAGFSKEAKRPAALAAFGLEPDRKTLLVFGGSQGARRINEAAAGLADAWSDRSDLQILHISGPSTFEELSARARSGVGSRCIYRLVGFVDDMTDVYSVADLALCRGGATTLAELAVVGLPAVVVPYPYHRDRQQERQARVFERAGAALVLDDDATTTGSVSSLAGDLLADEARLSQMGEDCRKLARPDAADRLADVVRSVAR